MTDEMPSGWVETTVGDVCLPVSQRGPSSDKASFRYVDLGAMDNKKRRISDPSTVPTAEAPSRAKQIVRAGDVVFSTVRVYLENIGLVPPELDGEVASTAFCVLRPASGIDPRYLYYYVTSRPFIISVNKLQRGNSPPSVQDGDVRRQRLPIAPSEEQRRIASKIDELFSRIDEGERALERVSMLVERYRQSVLKAAVTGELTRAWREKNKDTLESGKALLARILTARRAAWEQAELEKMKAKGITPANDKWKHRYQEPSPPDSTVLPVLPPGWAWTTLDALTIWGPQNGLYLHKDHYGRGVPIVRIDDYQLGWSRPVAELQKVSATSDDQEKYGLLPGDLVINRVNSTSHLGKCMVATEEHEGAVFESNMMRLSTTRLASVSFLELYLRSDLGRARLIANCKHAVNQASINQDDVAETPIPLPSIQEQAAVEEVAARELSKVGTDTLDTLAISRRSQALRQGVLRSAFEGRLVPALPTDKPASTLLERIAAERRAGTAAPRGGRKKKITA